MHIDYKRMSQWDKKLPLTPASQTLVVTEDSEASLRAILKYSLLQSESELQEQLDSIQGKKGTKILIWNIRRSVRVAWRRSVVVKDDVTEQMQTGEQLCSVS